MLPTDPFGVSLEPTSPRIAQIDRRVATMSVDIEERLFREACQYTEKATVKDFVTIRKLFNAISIVIEPDARLDRSVRRLMQQSSHSYATIEVNLASATELLKRRGWGIP